MSSDCRPKTEDKDDDEDDYDKKQADKAFAQPIRFNYRSTVTTGDPG